MVETFTWIISGILYFGSGMVSFVYWWTREYDFTNHEIPPMILCSFVGPLMFVIGWSTNKSKTSRVIFKKRTPK